MRVTKKYLNDLTYKVIGCAIEVHKSLGPGLLESVYEKCLIKEFELQGLRYKSQFWVPLNYKGLELNSELRLDLLVEDILCVELKAQEDILPIHQATLLSYMQMLEMPKGLIINFCSTNIFKEGQKTFVNNLFAQLADE
ncbi:MAG TPA: GxxExxY protein [Chitinophagaceae bacterium]|nr:GxxExxY protein [Chitinophagaceae bacterium]